MHLHRFKRCPSPSTHRDGSERLDAHVRLVSPTSHRTCLPPALRASASFFSRSLPSLARCFFFISAAFSSVSSALTAELASDSWACVAPQQWTDPSRRPMARVALSDGGSTQALARGRSAHLQVFGALAVRRAAETDRCLVLLALGLQRLRVLGVCSRCLLRCSGCLLEVGFAFLLRALELSNRLRASDLCSRIRFKGVALLLELRCQLDELL